jgi:centromere protein I
MPLGPDTATFIKLSITPLMEHMNALALTIAECTSEVIIHSLVLDSYESAACLISQTSLQTAIRVVIPPPELVYIILFTSSLSNISRLCAILAIYKDTLKAHVDKVPNMYKKDVLNSFNGYIMDICNLVWRMKAFSTEQNALGCLVCSCPCTTFFIWRFL